MNVVCKSNFYKGNETISKKSIYIEKEKKRKRKKKLISLKGGILSNLEKLALEILDSHFSLDFKGKIMLFLFKLKIILIVFIFNFL